MASKTKSWLSLGLKLTVAAGLITYMIQSGHLNLESLWNLMTFQNVFWALVLAGANLAVAAWRWLILLRARGFEVSFFYGFSLYLIGLFFNHALPGSVGGDVVKGYYVMSDYPQRRMDAALSVLIDRVLGLYSFFILTLMAAAWDFEFISQNEKIRWVTALCFFIFLGMTLFFLLSFSTRLYHWSGLAFIIRQVSFLARLMEAFQRFGKNRTAIAASVAVSLLGQSFTMLFFYQMASIMGEPGVTWQAVLFAVPMGFVVTAVPISPAGIGVGQVAFHYLFQTYLNHPTQFGTTAITAYQLCVIGWAILGAVLYVRRRKPQQLADAVEAAS